MVVVLVSESLTELIDVELDPPNINIELELDDPTGTGRVFSLGYEIPLERIVDIQSDNVEVVEATETGLVVDRGDGTNHVDLRDIDV
jgi:hypothetical protein